MTAPTTVLFDAPGPKARVRHLIIGIVGLVVLLLILGLVIRGLANPRNNQLTAEKWSPFLQPSTWLDYLLPGLLSTLKAAGLAIVLSLVFGILLGIGRLSKIRVVSMVSGVFVEFFRSVPVLVMMLFAYYFALYVLHLASNQPFFGVVVGLVFYNSSVIAELIRSGVGSLPSGQREAGLAVGLTEGQAMWSILLPQAITAMLPSLISQLVVVLKDTALGYIIGYYDLVRGGQTFSTNFGNLIPTMLVMAAMFIVINYALTRIAQGVEHSLQRRGRAGGQPDESLPGELTQPPVVAQL
ncbi:amino acid ABC transporter permease [Microlunatus sp. Gsoil 973]|uniref:amino acid ABC transporter permease n=1 Tax=Microlunatus sp. Gsoil 973 TaxID=2672569 RepID=UPI0012B4ED54|nr:amino acid ABC transporter permease [Microlunatus sp. Gsoil 973]QGN33048.1 ABC transporter permease subunit [Microlunatus sp. Gsoil 973]